MRVNKQDIQKWQFYINVTMQGDVPTSVYNVKTKN
jgi:hypothetical protein